MAVNIYLAFYRHYSGKDLKRLEKWYFVVCYGLPLIPAVVMLCIKTEERGPIYGSAVVFDSHQC
jgi:hypothetical protein